MKPQELWELASKPIAGEHKRTKLVVSDIEGCLNLDEKTYDHEALAWIRLANQLASPRNAIPFITVCSGRQHAFVEAIVRMIAGRMPAIFENGCGLFFPTRGLYDEYEWHPSLNQSDVASEYAKTRQIVAEICNRTGARRVIGKEVLLTLHPAPPMTATELYRTVASTFSAIGIQASVSNSASAVDIAPLGIDKGIGLQWLVTKVAEEFPLELSQVAGIGDSKGDLPFLRIVGFSAAPANAAEELRAMVTYCSPASDGKGVADIIQQCIASNLKHGEGEEEVYHESIRLSSQELG